VKLAAQNGSVRGLRRVHEVKKSGAGMANRMDAIELSQDGEREDDLAILVPLVGATEQIADAPDEAGDLKVGFRGHGGRWSMQTDAGPEVGRKGAAEKAFVPELELRPKASQLTAE
jgi:hypothetical protein